MTNLSPPPLDGTISPAMAIWLQELVQILNSKEPALGNPPADGDKLVSTKAGVRSWTP